MKKKYKALEENWGRPKDDYFESNQIGEYFEFNESSKNSYSISDKVSHDLDFKSFFQFIDRTTSAVGQQYLYDKVRNVNCTPDSLAVLENKITHYTQSNEKRLAVQKILTSLSTSNDYYFPFLIFGALPPKLKFINGIKVLQVLIVLFLIAGFFKPFFFLLVLLSYTIHLGLHYWHKNRIGNFAHIFSRLNKLTSTCKQLHSFSPEKEKDEILESIKNVNQITANIYFLKTNNLQENEFASIFWLILEFFKIFTLSEITIFHKVVDQIENRRNDIKKLFEYIGEIDTAISIGSLRTGLPFFSKPIFERNKKEIELESVYHPLVENCVTNDLHLIKKGLLLTGSNMSGKSTFVKAINLNAIAAQTLNTSFTEKYVAPIFAIFSSIKIEDDIDSGRSYFLEEVASIGEMMEASNSETVQYLFTIDEVFKGTNTIERVSAAKAILSYLNKKNHLVLVSTHDIELTSFLQEEYDLYYFQESVANENLTFDYQLKQGELKEKNAIKILELAGYPKSVVEEAKILADKIEQNKQQ